MSQTNPLILLIETSGEVCSVALAKGKTIVSEVAVEEANTHSKYLASLVQQLLIQNALEVNSLDAIAIAGGPGSYTGLRIGCSLAKGLCFGANIPLIACSSLKALASSALSNGAKSNKILALIDARRMVAYAGFFNNKLEELEEEKFVELDADFNNAMIKGENITAIGNGVDKWLAEFNLPNISIIRHKHLLARHLLFEALECFSSNNFVDVAYYEPNYIKAVYLTKPKPKF